jgi:hypothetical protein
LKMTGGAGLTREDSRTIESGGDEVAQADVGSAVLGPTSQCIDWRLLTLFWAAADAGRIESDDVRRSCGTWAPPYSRG